MLVFVSSNSNSVNVLVLPVFSPPYNTTNPFGLNIFFPRFRGFANFAFWLCLMSMSDFSIINLFPLPSTPEMGKSQKERRGCLYCPPIPHTGSRIALHQDKQHESAHAVRYDGPSHCGNDHSGRVSYTQRGRSVAYLLML